jgi:cytochrome b561
MPIRNTADRWGGVSITLHWLIAAAVLFMGALGLYMKGLPFGSDKIALYALHKSTGLTVLALVLLRLGWRLFAGRPRPPPAMPPWQRLASKMSHALLYLLLIALPLAGWLLHSASDLRLKLRWFGLFDVPSIAEPSRELRVFAGQLHEALFWTLMLLVVVHVGAALKHHFIDRDNVLRGMLGFKPHQGSNS